MRIVIKFWVLFPLSIAIKCGNVFLQNDITFLLNHGRNNWNSSLLPFIVMIYEVKWKFTFTVGKMRWWDLTLISLHAYLYTQLKPGFSKRSFYVVHNIDNANWTFKFVYMTQSRYHTCTKGFCWIFSHAQVMWNVDDSSVNVRM